MSVTRFSKRILVSLALLFAASRAPAQDLTGIWRDENGTRYVIRQSGDDLCWTMEMLPIASTVFWASVMPPLVVGTWLDLPNGQRRGAGQMVLRIESDNRIVKLKDVQGTYGASTWTREGNVAAGGGDRTGVGVSGLDLRNILAGRKQGSQACDYPMSMPLQSRWNQLGGPQGKLGCPSAAEIDAPMSFRGTTGRMIQFGRNDGGYLVLHGFGPLAGRVFEVSGCMFKIYSSNGATGSSLGFPTSDEYATPTGARQDFEGGYIVWDSRTFQCQAYR